MMENLSSLANLASTYGGALVMAEGFHLVSITAVALIFVLVAEQLMKREQKSSRTRGSVRKKRVFGRIFKSQRNPMFKPCPNCAEQLPLTAVICGICDYNFLAERPGRGQKLLPPPQPSTQEMPEQKILSGELIKPSETLGIVL